MTESKTKIRSGELVKVKDNDIVVIRVGSEDVEVEYDSARRRVSPGSIVPVVLLKKGGIIVGECIAPKNVREPKHPTDLAKREAYLALVKQIRID